MLLSDEAQARLRQKGLLRLGGRVDRKAMVPLVVEVLSGHSTPEKAIGPETIAEEVFGYADPELVRVVAQITSMKGPVQQAINGRGGILCLTRIEEPKRLASGAISKRKTVGRFIADDDDTVYRYCLETIGNRHVSRVGSDAEFILETVLKRRPALAQRMPEFKGLLQGGLNERLKALPG